MYRDRRNTADEAKRVVDEALEIQNAGVFMRILEHIPFSLAHTIINTLKIPTIDIGAGPYCDGQVLVINDALGRGEIWPPFSK